MSGWSDEVDPNAVLVGAEAYQRMLDDCDERLRLSNTRIDGYEGTSATLKNLLKTCQQELLVPVAGGLGYFEGTLKHTNNVLVLLGENLFAERSVNDALGIAERRVGYLKAERTALDRERKDIVDKQRLFVECGVEGSASDAKVKVANPATAAKKASAAPTSNKAAAPAPSSASAAKSSAAPSAATTTVQQVSEGKADTNTNNGPDDHMMQYDYDDEAGVGTYAEDDDDNNEENFDEDDIIDPADELTLDELVALEDELGDDINDEEKAEAAIMALVNKKKAARRAREAALLGGGNTPRGAAATEKKVVAEKAPAAAAPTSALEGGAPATGPSPSTSTAAEASSGKHVHFDPSAADNNTTCSTSAPTNDEGLAMPLTVAATAFASPADIGKMFTNIGATAAEGEDAVVPLTADDPEAEEARRELQSAAAAVAAAKQKDQERAKEAALIAAQQQAEEEAEAKLRAAAIAAAKPAAFPFPTTSASSSGAASTVRKPFSDEIVEKNIPSALGAFGGGAGASSSLGHSADMMKPAAGGGGSSSSGATIKKRSLFGQGMGLK